MTRRKPTAQVWCDSCKRTHAEPWCEKEPTCPRCAAADALAEAVEAFVNDAYSYSQTHGVCPCGSDEKYCHFDATTTEEHLPLLRAALVAYAWAR